MNQKLIIAFGIAFGVLSFFDAAAQSGKNKKSRYFQNNPADEEIDVKGFEFDYQKRKDRQNLEKKIEKEEYVVDVKHNDEVGKYTGESKIKNEPKVAKPKVLRENSKMHWNLFGSRKAAAAKKADNNIYIGMSKEADEYRTTVVTKKYTSLDILADDLDLARIQRPVFKGICSECDIDVDRIITDKNLTSLEKNYRLKHSYMLRDKRLKETLEDDQYKKWLRIKDDDEYLILTKDLELQDGIYK